MDKFLSEDNRRYLAENAFIGLRNKHVGGNLQKFTDIEKKIQSLIKNNISAMMSHFAVRFRPDMMYSLAPNSRVLDQLNFLNAKFLDSAVPEMSYMLGPSNGYGGETETMPRVAYVMSDGMSASTRSIVADARRESVCDKNTHQSVYEDLNTERCARGDPIARGKSQTDNILKSWRYPSTPRGFRDDSVGSITLQNDARSANTSIPAPWGDGTAHGPAPAPARYYGSDSTIGASTRSYDERDIGGDVAHRHRDERIHDVRPKPGQYNTPDSVDNLAERMTVRQQNNPSTRGMMTCTGDYPRNENGTLGGASMYNTAGRAPNSTAAVCYGGEDYQGNLEGESGVSSGRFEAPYAPRESAQHERQLLDAPFVHMLNSGSDVPKRVPERVLYPIRNAPPPHDDNRNHGSQNDSTPLSEILGTAEHYTTGTLYDAVDDAMGQPRGKYGNYRTPFGYSVRPVCSREAPILAMPASAATSRQMSPEGPIISPTTALDITTGGNAERRRGSSRAFTEENRPKLWADGGGFADQSSDASMRRLLARENVRKYGSSSNNTLHMMDRDGKPPLDIFWSGEIYNDQIPYWRRALHKRRYDYDAEENVGGFEFDGLHRDKHDMSSLYRRVAKESDRRNWGIL